MQDKFSKSLHLIKPNFSSFLPSPPFSNTIGKILISFDTKAWNLCHIWLFSPPSTSKHLPNPSGSLSTTSPKIYSSLSLLLLLILSCHRFSLASTIQPTSLLKILIVALGFFSLYIIKFLKVFLTPITQATLPPVWVPSLATTCLPHQVEDCVPNLQGPQKSTPLDKSALFPVHLLMYTALLKFLIYIYSSSPPITYYCTLFHATLYPWKTLPNLIHWGITTSII